ncbi:MAG: PilZ domain-containing protein [Spirochaetota bacterium]
MDQGREVFFLYPPSVLEEQLLNIVVQAEYEVYLLKDHQKAPVLLAEYPGSIVFVNIDERIRGDSWEEWIARLLSTEATRSVRVGVLSYNDDPALAQYYLMELSVPCGFIKLKLGLKESAKILLTVLEANEARGKRRFVRAAIPSSSTARFNVRMAGALYRGDIADISVAGMACIFEEQVDIAVGDSVRDIQLNLRGRNVTVTGTVAGTRTVDGRQLFVLMFEQASDDRIRQKLHDFIHVTLQSEMDRKLQNIKVTQ